MSCATEDINRLLLCEECFTNIVWQVTEQAEFWQALSGLIETGGRRRKENFVYAFLREIRTPGNIRPGGNGTYSVDAPV